MVFKPPRSISLGFIFLLGDILWRWVNVRANSKRKKGFTVTAYLWYLLRYSKLHRYDLEKESIPKINSFFWTLADNNLLSSNNQERKTGALGPLDALSVNWWRIMSPYLLGMQFFKLSVLFVTRRKYQSSDKTMERGLLQHFVRWREPYTRFCDMERGLLQVPKQ